MSKSRQGISGTHVDGEIVQSSDQSEAIQEIEGGRAAKVDQVVRQQASLTFAGKYKASGLVAVIILGVVAMGWLYLS